MVHWIQEVVQMGEKRTRSMEIRAIRRSMDECPPPAPAGTSLREWFAGLALANPELMKDLAPAARAREAVRLADDLALALATSKVPSQESLAAPSEEAMVAWDAVIENQRKDTVPPGRLMASKARRETKAFGTGILPPTLPALPAPVAPVVISAKKPSSRPLPAPTTYSSLRDEPRDEIQ